jgi:hypothetical protein
MVDYFCVLSLIHSDNAAFASVDTSNVPSDHLTLLAPAFRMEQRRVSRESRKARRRLNIAAIGDGAESNRKVAADLGRVEAG